MLADPRVNIFDAQFITCPHDFPASFRTFFYRDKDHDPDAIPLVRAIAGKSALLGVLDTVDAVLRGSAPILLSSRNWPAIATDLAARGCDLRRLFILLHFQDDPNGWWDFARANIDVLPELLSGSALSDATWAKVGTYVQHWTNGRIARGRVLPGPGMYMGDYRDVVSAHAGEIQRVLASLADATSRQHYATIVLGSADEVVASYLNGFAGAQQYMEILPLAPGDHLVNCGVGSGWELPYFLVKMQGRGRINNIDPVLGFHNTWSGPAIDAFHEHFRHLPFIIGATDKTETFEYGDFGMVMSGSTAGTANGKSFTCRSLDSLVRSGEIERVDAVKMDIEGGEPDALRGMVETLRTQRPSLAVATYHEPSHFWEIPTFLMNTLERYRFYVRHYAYSRFETLLYAVPEEKDATAAVSRPRAPWAKASCTFHLADGDPRTFYHGSTHTFLTRVSGVRWQTADISTGPDIAGQHVACVAERDGRPHHIFSLVGSGPDCMVCIGRFEGGTKLTWLAYHQMGECDFVPGWRANGSHDIFGCYDAAAGKLALFSFDGEAITQTGEFAVGDAMPLLIGASTLLLRQAGDLVEMTVGPDSMLSAPRRLAGISGQWRGVCIAERLGVNHTSGVGYVTQREGAPDTLDVYLPEDGRCAKGAEFPSEAGVFVSTVATADS